MKLYVASSWRNVYQPHIVELLTGVEHEVYDFRHPHLGPGARGGFHWSDIDSEWERWSPTQFIRALEDPLAKDGAAADLEGLNWAEGLVLVMPCGRSSHLELGYVIGQGKPTFVLLTDGEPELMYSLVSHLCDTTDRLLACVAAEHIQIERIKDGIASGA